MILIDFSNDFPMADQQLIAQPEVLRVADDRQAAADVAARRHGHQIRLDVPASHGDDPTSPALCQQIMPKQ